MPAIFDVPKWYDALDLSERAGLPARHEVPAAPIDMDLAARRAERWRREAGLEDDEFFAARLALDGLDEAAFLDLLGEPAPSLASRCTHPPWLRRLAEAFEPDADDEARSSMPLDMVSSPHAGYLELIRPLLDDAYTRLHQGIHALVIKGPQLALEPVAAARLLVGRMPGQVLWLLSRTLTMELQIAGVEERLVGDTPEQRFASFTESLRARETALDILCRYPVLARSIVEILDQWIDASLEFLRRLVADYESLDRTFSPKDGIGGLSGLATALSDRHGGGRTVLGLTFTSGLKLIYKPRPMAVEARFQELLAWLNGRGAEPPFRTLTVLDRGAYGWVEYVEPRPAADGGEVERFYERQGAFIALLYALEATDFHFENLIAAGDHPVLIDIETLFHPHLVDLESRPIDLISPTVLRSGLLPQSFRQDAKVDASGLGAAPGQKVERHDITGVGTDRMRHVYRETEIVRQDHSPLPAGTSADLREKSAPILRGFRRMYRLLMQRRHELLAADGPLAPFADVEIRVLLRGTEIYVRLLLSGFHPDLVPNALSCDRVFDKLWLGAAHFPLPFEVIRAEHSELKRGDVPRFTARPGSRNLEASGGGAWPGILPASGMELVERRLAALGDADLERQTWIVETALATARPGPESPAERPGLPEAQLAWHAEDFLDAARTLGDRLLTLAIRQGEQIGWLGIERTRDSVPSGATLQPLGFDLYHGTPGVTLFLAQLGRMTGEDRYVSAARAAWQTLQRAVERFPGSIETIGAWSGWGGLIYTAASLGFLWDENVLFDQAESWIVSHLSPLVEKDQRFDLIDGAAGALGAVLTLYSRRPQEAAAAALACGEHLLQNAVIEERFTTWPSASTEVPLTGFAHGASGIAWALNRLHELTGERRFEDAARGALAYERHSYVPEEKNWPDLRNGQNEPAFVHAWCHGAPGIGLGRLGLSKPRKPGTTRRFGTPLAACRAGFSRALGRMAGDAASVRLSSRPD